MYGYLLTELEECKADTGKKVTTKEGKSYNTDTRICMYRALLNNVSVGAAGQLLKFFLEQEAGLILDLSVCLSSLQWLKWPMR